MDILKFQNISDLTANRRRTEYYRSIVEQKVAECEHCQLLGTSGIDSKGRDRVLTHLIDVVLRAKLGFGTPGELTLDDVLCLSVAMQLRAKETRQATQPLLEYLEIDDKSKEVLAAALARYEAILLGRMAPATVKILRSEFTKKWRKAEVVKARLAVNQGAIDRLIADARKFDRQGLAIFYLGSDPESTLTKGQNAYYDGGPVTLGSTWKQGYRRR